jgi:hypothetical protein
MWHDAIASFAFFSPLYRFAVVIGGRVLEKIVLIIQIGSLATAIIEIGSAEG